MENSRLKATMAKHDITAQALAEQIEVDAKTVERWMNTGRVPYTRSAVRAAEVLEEDPVFEKRTAPQRQHRGERVSRRLGVATFECDVAVRYAPLEVVRVHVLRGDPEEVAGWTGRDGCLHPTGDQRSANARDMTTQRHLGTGGRMFVPHRIDEVVDGDDPGGIEKQPRQQAAWPLTSKFERGVVASDLERTEDAELWRRRLMRRCRRTCGLLPRRFHSYSTPLRETAAGRRLTDRRRRGGRR